MRYFFLISPDGEELEQVGLSHGEPDPSPQYPDAVWIEAEGSGRTHMAALVEGQPCVVARPVDEADMLLRARASRWSSVKRIRDAAFLVTPTDYGLFDSDQAGRDNIAGKLDEWREREKLGLPLPTAVTWKLATNGFVELTPEQLRQIGIRLSDYRGQVYARSWELEAEIFTVASTVSEIEAIDITAGWPT